MIDVTEFYKSNGRLVYGKVNIITVFLFPYSTRQRAWYSHKYLPKLTSNELLQYYMELKISSNNKKTKKSFLWKSSP